MIIDAHAHIYPNAIADKAVHGISNFYDGRSIFGTGTVENLIEVERRAGVSKILVHSVATTPSQVHSITDFIGEEIKKYPDTLIGFTSVYPDMDDPVKEIERAVSKGIVGIKLHPDFQKFEADSDKAMAIYEVCEGRLPILFHAGDFRTEYSKAKRILKVKEKFPKLDIIAAHFGGWSEWEESVDILKGTGIYVDSSSTLGFIDSGRVRKLMDSVGSDYILFGTDYPMWNPADEIEMLNKLFVSEEEKEKIFHLNFEKLLGRYIKERYRVFTE